VIRQAFALLVLLNGVDRVWLVPSMQRELLSAVQHEAVAAFRDTRRYNEAASGIAVAITAVEKQMAAICEVANTVQGSRTRDRRGLSQDRWRQSGSTEADAADCRVSPPRSTLPSRPCCLTAPSPLRDRVQAA
jgi:hypothetical protein